MTRRVTVCVFERAEDIVGAAAATRGQGVLIADAYTPYAVHGLDRAMGLAPSRIPWVCFTCGLVGATSFLAFQYWASTVSWAINVGGRPWNSLPAFVPATFEVMVLFAGIGTVLAFLIAAGLRPGGRLDLPDPRVTDDRFVLILVADKVESSALRTLLARFRPVSIEERDEVRRADAGKPR